jgi:hypothetical protein
MGTYKKYGPLASFAESYRQPKENRPRKIGPGRHNENILMFNKGNNKLAKKQKKDAKFKLKQAKRVGNKQNIKKFQNLVDEANTGIFKRPKSK